jgi:hypothetical protein
MPAQCKQMNTPQLTLAHEGRRAGSELAQSAQLQGVNSTPVAQNAAKLHHWKLGGAGVSPTLFLTAQPHPHAIQGRATVHSIARAIVRAGHEGSQAGLQSSSLVRADCRFCVGARGCHGCLCGGRGAAHSAALVLKFWSILMLR